MVVKAKKESAVKMWRFSTLDMSVGDMVIKSVWVFPVRLDTVKMAEGLSVLLERYPFLAGRLKSAAGIECNNEGVFFEVTERSDTNTAAVLSNPDIYNDYALRLDMKGFKEGRCAPATFCVTNIVDGSVLSVQMAHICMDGSAFYRMVDDWGMICREVAHSFTQVSQYLVPELPFKSKSAVISEAEKNGWKKLGFKQLFKMIFYSMSKNSKLFSEPAVIGGEMLEKAKTAVSASAGMEIGTHALLSAVLLKMCMKLNASHNEDYSLISVTDIRGRYSAIPADYVGNAVSNIVTPSLNTESSLHELAKQIQVNNKRYFDNAGNILDDYVNLNIYSVKYRLPYLGFDVESMNDKNPKAIYINNQLRFNVYGLDFGNGRPSVVIPNDLPDMVKLWPVNDGKGSVMIILRGYVAKKAMRYGDINTLVNSILKEII
ncbi:MAG: acyltransferase [Candidatus Limimorpha sp.]